MLQLILLMSVVGLASSLFNETLHNMYLMIPREEFVAYFNSQNYTWKMREEPHDNYYTGCVLTGATVTLPIKRHGPEAIAIAPESFDARTQWPQCMSINKIYDQGQCGSCWTFGTATTASDRTCIHKGEQVELAEQDFECMSQRVCDGGNPADAFAFWRDTGMVTQLCKPYDILKLNQSNCTTACVDGSIDYNSDKHHGGEVYSVASDIDSIKVELSQNGPVEAIITVYLDFMKDYHGGIYEHTHGKLLGPHSVRIIGYGVENGVAYWLGANSWGEVWGESGYFKIKQNLPDIGTETRMFTGKPK